MKNISVFLFTLVAFSVVAQSNNKKEIVRRMINANEAMRTAKFSMHMEERLINGKFEIKDIRAKLNRVPAKIYFYAVTPNAGTEIIWKNGWNEDRMYVSPGSFPFMNFSMKLNSSLARRDSHHPLNTLGFDYLMGLLVYYQKTMGDKFFESISISDTVSWENRTCIVVNYDNKDYHEVSYTVKPNENIISIAAKLHLNDYSILMLNPSVSDFDDVEAGQVIKVPNFYCRSIQFYVDRATGLPLRQVISDSKGVYEKYEMKNFLLNPAFKSDEFDPEFKDYKF